MSLKMRLSLLSGSSLIAAGLAAAASLAVAPSSASAQSACTPAPSSGAGTNTVSYTGNQNAGITCTATGLLTINKVSGNVAGAAGITVTSTGGLVINNGGTIGNATGGAVNFAGVTGGGVTLIHSGTTGNAGRWTHGAGASVFSAGNDVVTMLGVGTNTMNGGSVSFGTGNDALDVNGNIVPGALGGRFLLTGGTMDFGAGADELNVSGQLYIFSPGTINLGADADAVNSTGNFTLSGILDFGAGNDVFNQDGRLFVNPENGAELRGLEALNNTGDIALGGTPDFENPFATNTDGFAETALHITGGVFTGSGASRILFDAILGDTGSQLDCTTPTVSDCITFTGATTAGETALYVRDISFDVNGGTIGAVITLVEDATAPEHFVLDPTSPYYARTAQGDAIRKPVVAYYFVYDDANQRHLLIGAPTAEMFEVGTYAASAQETWRTTTATWLGRQADLRAAPGGLETSGGLWARVSAQSGDRDLGASYTAEGQTLDYDITHKQRIAHLVFGADFLGATGEDSAWVVGGMIGYARSDVEYAASTTEAVSAGATGGLYASYIAGPLFVDAVANLNIQHVKAKAPAMNLGLDVPMIFDQKSLGAQIEAGWRIPMGEALFVEPLVGASYVVTRFEDTEVPGGSGEFEFEESKSLRAGAGARVGLDGELMGMAAAYSLTGRYWNDSEGQGSATITTASGSSALLEDDFGGGFTDISASINLYSNDGGLSGFVNLGGKFADGYQAIDGSVGVRVRW